MNNARGKIFKELRTQPGSIGRWRDKIKHSFRVIKRLDQKVAWINER